MSIEQGSKKAKIEPEHDERIANILKNENKGFVKRNVSIFADFWNFMRIRKKWWLLPIIITLILVGILVVFAHSSALSPFIYALF